MTAPIDAEEVPLKDEDAAKADASSRIPNNSARKAQDAESTRLQQERDVQIRLDEKMSRQELARVNREAVLDQERLQRGREE